MAARPHLLTLTVPKAGHTEEENEDRYGPVSAAVRRGGERILAVSDGATEAVFAREWADTLVQSKWTSLVGGHPPQDTEPTDKAHINDWLSEVRNAFDLAIGDRELPWYTQAKMRRHGAFATFLGVRLTHGHGVRRWSAVACGDSCLFHIANGAVNASFPINSPTEFGNRPFLVPSNNTQPLPIFQVSYGQSWTPGDAFVLATDALALWLLEEGASDGHLSALLKCESQETFRALVECERATHRIKNDDTTALIYVT